MDKKLPIEGLIPLLNTLVNSKNARFKVLLAHLNSKAVKLICEFSYNLIKGIITISEIDWARARSYRSLYKILASPRKSLKTKLNCLIDHPTFTKTFFRLIIKTFDDGT